METDERKSSLCFDCQRAVGACSWSKRFKPVDGWTAEPTKLKLYNHGFSESFRVIDCPLFIPDSKVTAEMLVGWHDYGILHEEE